MEIKLLHIFSIFILVLSLLNFIKYKKILKKEEEDNLSEIKKYYQSLYENNEN